MNKTDHHQWLPTENCFGSTSYNDRTFRIIVSKTCFSANSKPIPHEYIISSIKSHNSQGIWVLLEYLS